MLYESPKTKRYIAVGAIAIVLAVLAIVVIPLLFQDKTSQTPTANLPLTAEQQKIQKEQDKLIEMSRNQFNSAPSAEELQKDTNRLIEETKANGSGKSLEEIKKDQNSLINASKK